MNQGPPTRQATRGLSHSREIAQYTRLPRGRLRPSYGRVPCLSRALFLLSLTELHVSRNPKGHRHTGSDPTSTETVAASRSLTATECHLQSFDVLGPPFSNCRCRRRVKPGQPPDLRNARIVSCCAPY